MKRATTTFATGQRVIPQGHQLPDTDPLVKKRPRLFEPVPTDKPKRTRARKGAAGADGQA